MSSSVNLRSEALHVIVRIYLCLRSISTVYYHDVDMYASTHSITWGKGLSYLDSDAVLNSEIMTSSVTCVYRS